MVPGAEAASPEGTSAKAAGARRRDVDRLCRCSRCRPQPFWFGPIFCSGQADPDTTPLPFGHLGRASQHEHMQSGSAAVDSGRTENSAVPSLFRKDRLRLQCVGLLCLAYSISSKVSVFDHLGALTARASVASNCGSGLVEFYSPGGWNRGARRVPLGVSLEDV